MSDQRILVCDDQMTVTDIQKEVWIRILKEKVSVQHPAKDIEGNFYTDLTGLSDDFIAALKYCGVLDGQTVIDNGTTIAFSNIFKAYENEKWYIFEPPAQYLSGLTGYIIQDLPDSWIPPEYR